MTLVEQYEWLMNHLNNKGLEIGGCVSSVVKPIKLANGHYMSVQASDDHYCKPRLKHAYWTHVEVGFPSFYDELLLPYIDYWGDGPITDEEFMDSVFAYVPVEIVLEVAEANGGIVGIHEWEYDQ